MKAAVVSRFDTAPRREDVPEPIPSGEHDVLVEVLAAGLHPRVRSQADGSHYTSTDALPLVPGIDGVGRGPDGELRYFILPDTTRGSMAERAVIDVRRSVVLPADSDPIAVAAATNPAMAAWVALRCRVRFEAGSNVLVLGATGNAGRMAVQVARSFGANKIVGAARNRELLARLGSLGATDTVALDDASGARSSHLGRVAEDTDLVLDYLWGEPAAHAMTALITYRPDRAEPLTWIQIGSVAGPTAPIPSAAPRAARLQIVGSGQGSVTTAEILAELPELTHRISSGTFTLETRTIPLAEVGRAWTEAMHTTQRTVITPSSSPAS